MVNDIKEYQKNQRAQIYDSFKNAGDDARSALLITKSEFEVKFPTDQYERYSLSAVHKFREDISKSEEVTDKDAAFKDATKDLKSYVVTNEGKKAIVFVRKKIAGE
jgi:hypothetical protein